MTTKKELREALRRYVSAEETGDVMQVIEADKVARAILARPSVVVGYRVRGTVGGVVDFKLGETSLRADERPYAELWECMADAMGYQEDNGGTVRKLVRR